MFVVFLNNALSVFRMSMQKVIFEYERSVKSIPVAGDRSACACLYQINCMSVLLCRRTNVVCYYCVMFADLFLVFGFWFLDRVLQPFNRNFNNLSTNKRAIASTKLQSVSSITVPNARY